MENLWELVAKARGVELNEEFLYSWSSFTNKLRISEEGLEIYEDGQWYASSYAHVFIKGEGKIERLPFRPKKWELYYTIIQNTSTVSYPWADTTEDYGRLISGLVFRTREEAEAYIHTWIERINTL